VGLRDAFAKAGSDDAHIDGIGSVAGTVQGRPVRYLTETRKKNGGRTIATAPVPPGAAEVEIHLRPQTERDAELVERGLAIDVVVGEPLFDAAFLVEAAPEETVRALLDASTRAKLRALRPCELHVADGEVIFRKPGKITDPVMVSEVVRLMGGLAARLVAVGHEVEGQRMKALQEADAGYRGVTAVEATAKLAGHGASRELKVLHAVRARRVAGQLKLGAGIAGFFVIAYVILRILTSR
jgi:hypothetical protein